MNEKWTATEGTFDSMTYITDETGATVAVVPRRGTDAEHAARVAMIVNAPETARQLEGFRELHKIDLGAANGEKTSFDDALRAADKAGLMSESMRDEWLITGANHE